MRRALLLGRRWAPPVLALVAALAVARLVPAWWCGRDAAGWYRGDPALQRGLADALVAQEAAGAPRERAAAGGQWTLVTHQMVTLGLAQVILAHPGWRDRYLAPLGRAAARTLRPELREFGTRAWGGEDALASLDGDHGHAYLGYAALAVSVARQLGAELPAALIAQHDALIAAYARRLLASPTALIETYPGDAYPTDVAAVAAAIAVHGRATGVDHRAALAHWVAQVRTVQLDRASGLIVQRMRAHDGHRLDAPRGSGTGLAAYFAGFVDRELAAELTRGLLRHQATAWGFGGIREYAPGHEGAGDVDSGPVVLGVSVSATGFALGPARAFRHEDAFVRLYRTTELFGLSTSIGAGARFTSGGPLGNALLLALLTSGPELAP